MKVVKIIDGCCLLLDYIVVFYIAVVALYKSDSEVVRNAFMFFLLSGFGLSHISVGGLLMVNFQLLPWRVAISFMCRWCRTGFLVVFFTVLVVVGNWDNEYQNYLTIRILNSNLRWAFRGLKIVHIKKCPYSD
jgi:hypothetical protein